MFDLFKPAPYAERLPNDKVDPVYRRLRWQIFISIFVGYAAYYFVRKNFALAIPYLEAEMGYSKAQLGFAMSGVSIAYGLSKFLMGNVSDRSNPRYFLAAGLLLSGITMSLMGLFDWAISGVWIMFVLLFINGWFQGMGWPPCGKTMVHWWSKSERGTIVSVWNTAHNLGGGAPALFFILGMYLFSSWRSAFYMPGFAAIIMAFIIVVFMRDTPQSCGLPPIEEYKNEMEDYSPESEKVLSSKEIFMTYVFKNKLLWYIAVANVFVYLIRYGILDWSPTYLKEVKHFSLDKSSISYALYEYAGIPGTLLCGWMSDKVFRGNRGATGVFFMILVTIATVVYWKTPVGYATVDMICMIVIGFLIYGPVMLIGLHALELAPKNAAGTAAGFTGLFGYLGGSVAASAIIGITVQKVGWDGGFMIMVGGGVLSIILLIMTMISEGAHKKKLVS